MARVTTDFSAQSFFFFLILAFILIFSFFHWFILMILAFILKAAFLSITPSESEVVLKHPEPVRPPPWKDL